MVQFEGGFVMKNTNETKLRIVKEYFEDKETVTNLVKKYKIDKSHLLYFIKLYEAHGEKPFTDEQEKRVYKREEKLKAIEEFKKGLKSCRTIGVELAIPNPHTVQDWIKKFDKEGPDAIQDSKGRKAYKLHEDRQAYLADKEMKERLAHLEAENDYLKKLYSLIQEKNEKSKSKKR